jgi:hypothetical protein
MTDTAETYQGYTNRETWAFCLHYANDHQLYHRTLYTARGYLREHPEASDRELGQHLIDYWRERAHEYTTAPEEAIVMLTREVGSWWRVDPAEAGAAIRESLSIEA